MVKPIRGTLLLIALLLHTFSTPVPAQVNAHKETKAFLNVAASFADLCFAGINYELAVNNAIGDSIKGCRISSGLDGPFKKARQEAAKNTELSKALLDYYTKYRSLEEFSKPRSSERRLSYQNRISNLASELNELKMRINLLIP